MCKLVEVTAHENTSAPFSRFWELSHLGSLPWQLMQNALLIVYMMDSPGVCMAAGVDLPNLSVCE